MQSRLTEYTVQWTSRDALRKLTSLGARRTHAQQVFRLLLTHPEGLTLQEISTMLRLTINSVCGRLADLRKIELVNEELLVIDDGFRLNPHTNVRNLVWKINPNYIHLPNEVARHG